MNARAFVGAMLAPHDAEDAQLGIAGFPAQNRDDFPILGVGELVLRDEVGRDGRRRHARTATESSDWKTTKPSLDPMSDSAARSGCGMIPMTFRSRLRMAAMSRSEPFGLS